MKNGRCLGDKNGFIYLEWPATILYTETELKRISSHLYHPSTEKLFALIKRAETDDTNPYFADILTKLKARATHVKGMAISRTVSEFVSQTVNVSSFGQWKWLW